MAPNDHLRSLPGGRETTLWPKATPIILAHVIGPSVRQWVALCPVDFLPDHVHRTRDLDERFLRREAVEVRLPWHLNVHAQAIGPPPGFGDQLVGAVRDGLQVDVPEVVVIAAQGPRDGDELFHRRVGAVEYSRAQEEPVDEPAPMIVERERNHFVRREPSTLDVARSAVNAVRAIEHAFVREEDLEESEAAAVGSNALVMPSSFCRADRGSATLTAHDASYRAASARTSSLCSNDFTTATPVQRTPNRVSPKYTPKMRAGRILRCALEGPLTQRFSAAAKVAAGSGSEVCPVPRRGRPHGYPLPRGRA